jgi:hypothetical protein
MVNKKLLFYSKGNSFKFPLAVISGVCRSGKTLLGNLIATCPEVEYADEPWTGMVLPMAANSGKIEKEFASSMLSAYFFELFNDLILLRNANFRRRDLSSIWTKKTSEEIDLRLNNLNTRNDVINFSKSNRSTLVVTLAECSPFVDIILSAINRAQMVHVVRNGFDVAWEVSEKHWFSDEQLANPINAQLYSPLDLEGRTWYLPWWVDEGEEKKFLKLTNFERSLYYWCSLMTKGLEAFRSCKNKEILVRYEDLVTNPEHEFNRVISYLGFSQGKLSTQMLKKIKPLENDKTLPKIDPVILDTANKLNQQIRTMHG